MRLAWFGPLPPVRSGIATASAELVAALRGDHEIDTFVDGLPQSDATPGAPRAAHDFIWMHRQRPYDLTVYQLGNSSHHDFLWPYLFRYPGLVVLHDAHLHHARAALLLRERRTADYRAEFAANEPDASADAAELAVAGFDSFVHYLWPFTRLVCASARMVAVHSPRLRDHLRETFPGTSIAYVRLGHGTFVPESELPARRARARARYGIPPDARLFGCFGGLTPQKRLPQILNAFEAVLPYCPAAWLLLAGLGSELYDVRSDVRRRGLSRIVLAGYVEDDESLTDCIAACDVTLNLRWPTAREMSGPWLRCLAAGRASIVVDLAHTADLPALDPRTWRPQHADGGPPIAVAIDILDEDHSLRLAMRRLATDLPLCDEIGGAARACWLREHSQAAMVEDYRRLLAAAAAAPVPAAPLPAHVRADGGSRMATILEEFGLPVPWSKI